MTGFLFWNTQGKALQESLANLAENFVVDIILLAESKVEPVKILEALNKRKNNFHYIPQIGCQKIEVFTKYPPRFIKTIFELNRLTIRHLEIPESESILVAGMHFPSKVNMKPEDQISEMIEMSRAIREAEKEVNHSRTVLVGDLNMNPFESGVVNANALHGVMTQKIAQKKSRIVQEKSYPFFYNPMWRYFGDETPRPSGTHYYWHSGHNEYFWNIFDQVLIRPDLIDRFDSKSLEIVSSDGRDSFLKMDGTIDDRNFSDHLPLYFKINL